MSQRGVDPFREMLNLCQQRVFEDDPQKPNDPQPQDSQQEGTTFTESTDAELQRLVREIAVQKKQSLVSAGVAEQQTHELWRLELGVLETLQQVE